MTSVKSGWPSLGHPSRDDLDISELLEELQVLRGGVATVGVVRRAGRPLVELLGIGEFGQIDAAGHCVVHALARDAEGGGRTDLGVGGPATVSLFVVNASDA